MSTKVNYNSFPDKDFPPTPWSWCDENGYNSSTYIFCGDVPMVDMDFIEISDDCGFMAIDDKKLAAFIVCAVNNHAVLTAQNAWLKDRLSNLQLSPNSTKNIEEWLVECGMPSGGAS